MAPTGQTIVRFARQHLTYNAGELAGFPPHTAGPMIAKKVAAYVSGDVPSGIDAQAALAGEAASAAPAGALTPGSPALVPAGTGDATEDARLGTLKAATGGLNVSQAQGLIEQTGSIPDLVAIRAGEILHPDYQGGRKGVLEAIEARIADLQRAAEGGATQ